MAPLPKDLPFRIISKTIGMGAYASYVPPHAHEPQVTNDSSMTASAKRPPSIPTTPSSP